VFCAGRHFGPAHGLDRATQDQRPGSYSGGQFLVAVGWRWPGRLVLSLQSHSSLAPQFCLSAMARQSVQPALISSRIVAGRDLRALLALSARVGPAMPLLPRLLPSNAAADPGVHDHRLLRLLARRRPLAVFLDHRPDLAGSGRAVLPFQYPYAFPASRIPVSSGTRRAVLLNLA